MIGEIREWHLAPRLRESESAYNLAKDKISKYQLAKFNELWPSIQKNVPFYSNLITDGFISSDSLTWEDFSCLPKLTKAHIQQNLSLYQDTSKTVSHWSVTGGSTGTPIRIPRAKKENEVLTPNIWLGRSAYNIRPSDPMFHLWGHSHLFGRGWKRYAAHAIRTIKNTLLGYTTFSAYNLSSQRLREAGREIARLRPKYIVGYSRSLALLAKSVSDDRHVFHQLGLKAIIATSEGFYDDEDASFIEEVFGCPVVMEYGAAETGVIAYTQPDDGFYKVFWDHFLIEAVKIDETRSALLVTTLYPRAFPLIRYDIGDVALGVERVNESVIGFEKLEGRDNDLIEFMPGVCVHPEAFTHCVKSVPNVLGLQVIQEENNSISIRIMVDELHQVDESLVRQNLHSVHPKLSTCAIEYVQELEQTIAGKTRWIIRR